MMTDQVRRVLERNISNIGTLPTIVGSLMRILNDPRSSTRDLAKVISVDQVLCSKLLHIVNSAYCNLKQEVIDVQQAISLIGYNTIRCFMFCITLFDSNFSLQSGVTFDKEKFWYHSLSTGIICRTVGERLRLENPQDLFVAGLVHDIGKILMLQFMAEKFYKILEIAMKENISFYNVERRLFCTDHSEIGAWAMTRWGLPDMLIRCVQYHHLAPFNADCVELHEIVSLADSITKECEIGFSGDKIPSEYYDILKWKYNIKQRWIERVLMDVKRETEQYADIISNKKGNRTDKVIH